METVVANMKSDFTAVVRDEYGVHILKCKIIDEKRLYFQMLNKTKDVLLPCYEINADFGLLKFVKPNSTQKMIENKMSLTSNISRRTLLRYYSQFKLNALVDAYHRL